MPLLGIVAAEIGKKHCKSYQPVSPVKPVLPVKPVAPVKPVSPVAPVKPETQRKALRLKSEHGKPLP